MAAAMRTTLTTDPPTATPMDLSGVTLTTGRITDEARRAWWANAGSDVYDTAAARLEDEAPLLYPARQVLDLSD